jgi:hypothetical protein
LDVIWTDIKNPLGSRWAPGIVAVAQAEVLAHGKSMQPAGLSSANWEADLTKHVRGARTTPQEKEKVRFRAVFDLPPLLSN